MKGGVLLGCSLTLMATGCSLSTTTPSIPGGKSQLVRLVEEPAGAHCAHGGTAVQSGSDSNDSGRLEDKEVTSSSYVCSGGEGSANGAAQVRLDPEPAGSNCVNGG